MTASIKPYVYLIGQADRGAVKIGVSGAPAARVRDLQCGHPGELVILAMFPGGEDDEQKLHALFAAERLRGEWFKRSPRIRKFIEMIARKVDPVMAVAECRTSRQKRQERQAQERQRQAQDCKLKLAVATWQNISGIATLVGPNGEPLGPYTLKPAASPALTGPKKLPRSPAEPSCAASLEKQHHAQYRNPPLRASAA